MAKFTDDATHLLEYVGGKENIRAVTHCVTRMRFVLVDEKKADIKKSKRCLPLKEHSRRQVSFRLSSATKSAITIMNSRKSPASTV